MARSTDGGRSFGAPVVAADGRRRRRSRLAGAGARRSRDGARALARPSRPGGRGQEGRAPAQGRARRRGDGAEVGALLRHVGARASAERELTPGRLLLLQDGVVALGRRRGCYAAWRHVYAGNMRDIAFTVSRDGGAHVRAPARVSEDGWAIDGCPDDGPAMAVDAAGTVHIVWPTVIPGDEPQGAIFYASIARRRAASPRACACRRWAARSRRIRRWRWTATGRLFVAWDESIEGVRTAAYSVADRSAGGRALRRADPPGRRAGRRSIR